MLAVTSLMFCCSGFGGSCSMSIPTVPLPLNFWTSVGSSSLLLQPVGTMVENLPVVSGVPVSGDGDAVCGTDEPLDVGVAGPPQAVRSPQPATTTKAARRARITRGTWCGMDRGGGPV